MGLPLYLAMTSADFAKDCPYPAYMACHFSPGGTGLSNLPREFPKGTLLLVDDSAPFSGHDSKKILRQLEECLNLSPVGILLDLQRPGNDEVQALCKLLTTQLSCPVIVSELYAKGLSCPVLLPPVPLLTKLSDYLAPWKGREIWLEAAPACQVVTVTEEGSTAEDAMIDALPAPWFREEALFCRYHWTLENSAARFTIQRTKEDLQNLLAAAERMGVKGAVGLYQELKEPVK